MVPTLTEEKKDLSGYENKFQQLVSRLRKNRIVAFIDKEKETKAILINEKTFEEMESYIETANVLLGHPGILKECAMANKRSKHAISLDDLKKELGV
jgi:hypothetical protein